MTLNRVYQVNQSHHHRPYHAIGHHYLALCRSTDGIVKVKFMSVPTIILVKDAICSNSIIATVYGDRKLYTIEYSTHDKLNESPVCIAWPRMYCACVLNAWLHIRINEPRQNETLCWGFLSCVDAINCFPFISQYKSIVSINSTASDIRKMTDCWNCWFSFIFWGVSKYREMSKKWKRFFQNWKIKNTKHFHTTHINAFKHRRTRMNVIVTLTYIEIWLIL